MPSRRVPRPCLESYFPFDGHHHRRRNFALACRSLPESSNATSTAAEVNSHFPPPFGFLSAFRSFNSRLNAASN